MRGKAERPTSELDALGCDREKVRCPVRRRGLEPGPR